MKRHYDFSNAQRGKLSRPAGSLRIPVYLDDDVQKALTSKEVTSKGDLSKLVNSVLRTQLNLAELLKP